MSRISEKKVQFLFQKVGMRVVKSSFLGKGEASSVLKIETNRGIYALKTALYPERKEKVLNEAKFRDYFIKQGLTCVPAPVYSDSEIFTNGAVIYNFVDGTAPDFNDVGNLKQMAQTISQIHQIDYEIVEDGFSQIMRLYHSPEKTIHKITTKYPHLMNVLINSAFSSALSEYKVLLNEMKDKFTMGINSRLHGDLSNNFVIDQNGKIWLIDWENSEYGDIVDELCWFLYVNEISQENRIIFFQEYQNQFIPAPKIKLNEISKLYDATTPIFNICWGMGQMGIQLENNLEPPGRKLNDLAVSAKNWSEFYSDKTTSLIIKGINDLTQALN